MKFTRLCFVSLVCLLTIPMITMPTSAAEPSPDTADYIYVPSIDIVAQRGAEILQKIAVKPGQTIPITATVTIKSGGHFNISIPNKGQPMISAPATSVALVLSSGLVGTRSVTFVSADKGKIAVKVKPHTLKIMKDGKPYAFPADMTQKDIFHAVAINEGYGRYTFTFNVDVVTGKS